MGTPDFAVPSLKTLVDNGYEVVGVITATDKYGGRGKKRLIESAVKQYALQNGLKIFQPRNLKDPTFVEEVRTLGADLQVVVAFRMLPEVIWKMPPLGTINLHGSLLPKYRGAAPINWAVIRGEKVTGVTTFMLKHEIDTGDILLQRAIDIDEDETAGEVYQRLMYTGAEVLLETVKAIESGNYELKVQETGAVTKAPKIYHETCEIDFNQPTATVHDFIRGLSPFPTAWTQLDGKKLKIYRSRKEVTKHSFAPFRFFTDQKSFLKVSTRDGFIHLLELQLAGKKKMHFKDFLNGYQFSTDKEIASL